MTRDVRLLFAARCGRMAAFGAVSVVLALYLSALGMSTLRIGWLLSLTLAGDILFTFLITTHADRIGRKRLLTLSALFMIGAGLVFALSSSFWVLLVAAVIGVISPSGSEIGPFLPMEQAAIAQLVPGRRRTATFAWYNLCGSFATATGALLGGWGAQQLIVRTGDALFAYRVLLLSYALVGVALIGVFALLTAAVEPPVRSGPAPGRLGLHGARPIVLRLSSLFALDAFGGALVLQSLIALWLQERFGANPATLGVIFFWAGLLAGISALAAGRMAQRFGLIRTMVYTHIPSNVLLITVPFMPTLGWAVGVLLLRYSISQMDVPTRQSYVMAVVAPDERSAAAGVTGIARSVGAMPAPGLSTLLSGAVGWMGAPFVAAGLLKIVYDLLLYRNFRALPPPEER